MVYRVEDIPVTGVEADFTKEAGWLDERLTAEKMRSFHFLNPIRVHLKVTRSQNTIHIKSRIKAQVEWICARCLETFLLPLASEFSTTLKPRPEFPVQEEVELTREDLETDFYEGEEIDLTPLVQDQVLLTLPPKAVCREECRGLCSRCGKNLNQELCNCAEKEVDPRLAPLKSFRVH